MFSRDMKIFLFLLATCWTPLFAGLPQMSDEEDWRGYFVGWEGTTFDFGIQADGRSLIRPKARRRTDNAKEIYVDYVIEEEIKGKWVRRRIIKESGLSSENPKGLNPKDPIVFSMTVTGGTKVQWTHHAERKAFTVAPEILEKTTKNKVRIGIEFWLSYFYRSDGHSSERELKKMVGRDYLTGVRLSDGKEVRSKFSALEKDFMTEEFFKEGASALEIKSQALGGRTLSIKCASTEAGRIDLISKGPLYGNFKCLWIAEADKIGQKDTFISFGVE